MTMRFLLATLAAAGLSNAQSVLDYSNKSSLDNTDFFFGAGFGYSTDGEFEEEEPNFDSIFSLEFGYRVRFGRLATSLSIEASRSEANGQALLTTPTDIQIASDDGFSIVPTDPEVETVSETSAESENTSILINAKLSYEFNNNFTYYGGIGLGITRNDSSITGDSQQLTTGTALIDETGAFVSEDITTLSSEDSLFTFQAFVGVEYSFHESASLYGQFRYIVTDDIEFDTGSGTIETSPAIDTGVIEAGVRFYW